MADYKSIKGTKIQNYTTDPDNPLTGQVWYNETDQVLKVSTGPLFTGWATGNDMNTARYFLAGAGTQTSALAFGGFGPPVTTATESWDGTSWTEVNDLNSTRYILAGVGADNTAALAFGGLVNLPPFTNLAVTESWNGTSWTEVNDLNTARYYMGSAGTQTAALAFGGESPPTGATESWDGTSWTEVNDLNTARTNLAGAGTQTAALAFGGEAPPATAATEEWGTSGGNRTITSS